MRKMIFLALAAAATLLPASGATAETPTDRAIAQQIGVRLKESGQLRNYRIGVKYQDGVAWLDGTVTSQPQRDAAVRLAQQVDGVSHVVCRLEVPAGPAARMGEPTDLHLALQQAGMSPAPSHAAGVVHALAQDGSPGRLAETGRHTAGRVQSPMHMSRPHAMPQPMPRPQAGPQGNMPLPAQRMAMNPAIQQTSAHGAHHGGPAGGIPAGAAAGMAVPAAHVPGAHGAAVAYDTAHLPAYAWPSYAAYPNYAALTYPRQYSPTAWPYIGPFYPYPQVPLGWRKVSLEWDDGWWFLDFHHTGSSH